MQLDAKIIEGFVGSVLAKKFDQPAPIPDCHREWWDLCTSKERFVAIAAPRGHAKSTAITHSYTLACLMFRQRQFVLLVSDTETQAVLFLQDIRKELEDNEDLQELFGLAKDERGRVLFVKDSETDIICQFDDGVQFRIMAKGSEQKVRGLKWGSKRPDLIICDDLENDEIVMNPDRREKFRRWFYGALLPSRGEGGIVRVVGTILHLDSLLERLMPPEHDKMTVFEDLKVWTTKRMPWKSVKYRAHNDEKTKFLWPEKHSKDELEKIYQSYKEQGLSDVYYQEYLNRPIDESTALFRKSDFLPIKVEDREKPLNYYVACDLAVSEKQRADYTCFIVGGLDPDGRLQIRNVIRERMDAKQISDTMFALDRLYKPVAHAVEDHVISKSILPFVYEEMNKQQVYPNLVMILPSKDKLTRARAIQARMRAGGVKFDKDSDWYGKLEEEMIRFPRDRNDDQVDAMAYLGLIVDKMVEAPTREETAYLEREEELERTNDYGSDGRNATTGY